MSISTRLSRKNLDIVAPFCLQMSGILIMIIFYIFDEKQLSLVRSFCHLLSSEADDDGTMQGKPEIGPQSCWACIAKKKCTFFFFSHPRWSDFGNPLNRREP